MDESKLDASKNEYNELNYSKNYIKQLQWDMAIGLQEYGKYILLEKVIYVQQY